MSQSKNSSKVSLHVRPDIRDRVMALKYKEGFADADETVRHICQEAGVL